MALDVKKLKKSLDNKYVIIGGVLLLIAILILVFWNISSNSKDGAKFKREYEAYNNKQASGDHKYQVLKIPKKNKVKYSSVEGAIDILKDGTGLIYFGFPNCPWCRGMLPILLDSVDCSCVDNLLYVDMTDVRDKYEVKDGETTLVQEAKSGYNKLLEYLDKHLDDYVIKDEDGVEYDVGEKRIYVPLVVAVKNGEVVGVYDGIELEENQSPYDDLNETQKSEMQAIFTDMIGKMTKTDESSAVCDEHC